MIAWFRPSLDLRAVALCRIAMAVVCIGDLLRRMDDLQALHTVEGFVPPHMSQHQAPVHKFFFYRGSSAVQVGIVVHVRSYRAA